MICCGYGNIPQAGDGISGSAQNDIGIMRDFYVLFGEGGLTPRVAQLSDGQQGVGM